MCVTGTDVSVSWFKDGKPLKTGDGITVSREADIFKIQVIKCSAESAGEYTCTASNTAGSACCTANVIVAG
jgi:Immunoglobulin I-set domain